MICRSFHLFPCLVRHRFHLVSILISISIRNYFSAIPKPECRFVSKALLKTNVLALALNSIEVELELFSWIENRFWFVTQTKASDRQEWSLHTRDDTPHVFHLFYWNCIRTFIADRMSSTTTATTIHLCQCIARSQRYRQTKCTLCCIPRSAHSKWRCVNVTSALSYVRAFRNERCRILYIVRTLCGCMRASSLCETRSKCVKAKKRRTL